MERRTVGSPRWRFLPVAVLGGLTLLVSIVGLAQSPDPGVRTAREIAPRTTTSSSISGTSTAAFSSETTTSVSPPATDGTAGMTWNDLVDGLHMDAAVVDCPSTTLCVFTGGTPIPGTYGRYEQAVAVSKGPFDPGSRVVGNLTPLPTAQNEPVYVSCPGASLCVLSTFRAIFTSTAPLSGQWVQQVVATATDSFAGVSCPTATFCAVAVRDGKVEVSRDPTGGPGAWSMTSVTATPQLTLNVSCLADGLCAMGGLGLDSTTGWLAVSPEPDGGPGPWSGGELPAPALAEHSGAFLTTVTCVTPSFCAAQSDGVLVTTDPTGGVPTWQRRSTGLVSPGVARCQTNGECSVSSIGTFQASGSTSGLSGFPWPGVSCVSQSFCIAVDATKNNQVQVGGVTS